MFLPNAVRRDVFVNDFPQFSSYDDKSLLTLIKIYDKNLIQAKIHSKPHLIVFGGTLFFFSWMFFNAAAEFKIVGDSAKDPRRVMTITAMCMAFSGFVFYFIQVFESKTKSGRMIINEPVPILYAMIAGLVSSTASCGYIDDAGATIVGSTAAVIYWAFSKVVKRFEIDDPIETFQTHFACGSWSIIAVGLFHTESGLFYSGKPDLLGHQLLYLLSIYAWGAALGLGFFTACSQFSRLRIDQIYEIIGVDLLINATGKTKEGQQLDKKKS
jgi:ammonium transporter, Amt family